MSRCISLTHHYQTYTITTAPWLAAVNITTCSYSTCSYSSVVARSTNRIYTAATSITVSILTPTATTCTAI